MRFLAIILAVGGLAPGAWSQLRIVDYNTAAGARPDLGVLLAALGAESVNGVSKPPDVFSLQEQTSAVTQQIVDLLNGIYGAGTYARATSTGASSGAGTPGLIYNVTTVQLRATTTASTISSTGAARQTMRYQLRPVGYDAAADFFLYSSHYKASTGSANEVRRNGEALQVRANADALGEGAHVLYTGDFNIYGSREAMWGTLTAPGAGQAFDPINRVGNWSNSAAFRDVHTQSPVTTSRYGGQVTGGMDDRFDFQLVSGEFLDGEGLAYLDGSYHAFGNTNTHALNGEITSGSAAALQARLPGYSLAQATAVLNAIATSSDHLPVVAQYQLPAKMRATVAPAPARVLLGADTSVTVTIENVAPVLVSAGADELDYALATSGALAGAAQGSVLALTPGDGVAVTLTTDTVGAQVGAISVVSDSQAAADASFSAAVSYAVLDHARPAFGGPGEAGVRQIDFGTVPQFAEAQPFLLAVGNAAPVGGFFAGLDLDSIAVAGDGGRFVLTLTGFTSLAAGDFREFFLGLNTDIAGDYAARFELGFSDEDLPGATARESLVLEVRGTVVAVPESNALALLLLGGALLLAIRRLQGGQIPG